ncbi:hypothetical protein ACWD6L_04875 [Micromonospora profundi]|uniref:hypothetical protein n=1 Tax=Micromonospora TaxID=1873 RepID=UPI0012FAC7E8|nr:MULTISPECIES: hypothetical protein [Micromonospora]NJC13792.1 hypothetical protein [Micromonospora profundi]
MYLATCRSGIELFEAPDSPGPQRFVLAVKLLNQHRQSLFRVGFADQFEQPAAQAVGGLVVELGDQLVEVLRGVGSQLVKPVLLGLCIVVTHQPHGLLESACQSSPVRCLVERDRCLITGDW